MQVLYPGEIGIGNLDFVEGGKPENSEKNPLNKTRTINKLSLHIAPGQNRTRAALTRQYAIPVSTLVST